jgi:Mlc titration factor MtfA (ptsG expression regulator)
MPNFLPFIVFSATSLLTNQVLRIFLLFCVPVVDGKLRYLLKFYSLFFFPSENKEDFSRKEFEKPNKKHEQKMLS